MNTRLFVVLALAVLFLAACGQPIEKGDVIQIDQIQMVNPRDFGPFNWLIQQPDTCTLIAEGAEVVTKDGDFILVKQENCMGWTTTQSVR